jgi:hypothetical protein
MGTETKAKRAEKAEACERLRELVKPGERVYCVLRHVSASGMQRRIDFYTIGEDKRPIYLSGYIATALGMRRHDKQGLVVNGCGMDMGFHVVYELARTLWPDGYGCIGERCPSNDHSNGDRDYTPHGCFDEQGHAEERDPYPGEEKDGCVNHWHHDGGYFLRSEWI